MSWEILQADCIEQMRQMDEASVDAIVTDPPFGYWLAGLIDGEGCFRIQANKSRGRGPRTFAPTFALKLRDDDEPILREIAMRTGIGRFARDAVRSGNSKPCATWHVDAQQDCALLVELLDRYPLRTRKARDYAVWREAVSWWLSTPRGNRWHGSRDYYPIARLQVELARVRKYQRPKFCPRCGGEGEIRWNPGYPDPQTEDFAPCPDCGGEGVVPNVVDD